jgi:hypothetical protein
MAMNLGDRVLRGLKVTAAVLLLVWGMSGRSNAADRGEGPREKILADSLAGTKWLWHGKPQFVVEFRRDGVFELADWKRQGIAAVWKATGPHWVTVTVTSNKFKNLTANLVFNKDRTSFTGTDLDWNREIVQSPRVAN